MSNNTNDLGQLVFQSERQPLDFAMKYGKLTVPLVLALVAIFFSIPGLVNHIIILAGFPELAGATDDIPIIAIWVFLGVSMLYLIFCIARVSKFKGFQVSVYQKGAVLDLVKKTIKFHYDDFRWAEYKEIMKHTKLSEYRVYIQLRSKTLPYDFNEEDVPEAEIFVEEISQAYADYIIGKIKSEGIDNISVYFGAIKLENGIIEKMHVSAIKIIKEAPKHIEVIGIDDDDDEKSFFLYFNGFVNSEIFSYIIANHTTAQTYLDYVKNKIQSEGIINISIDFGAGMKLEDGRLVDGMINPKIMPLYNVRTVEIERDAYKISGTLENGNEDRLYWNFKYLQNGELLAHIISKHTTAEEITEEEIISPPPSTIEFDADVIVSEKMQAFEEKHRLPIEKENYLAFSAILALSNHDSYKVFKIQWVPKFIIKKGLKNMWGITDRQTALDTLADLAEAKLSAPRANDVYAQVKNGEASEIYKRAKENLISLGFMASEIDNITSLNAWDYGRAGFIARNAVFSGFLEEEETWDYLRQAANNAVKDYKNWREYLGAYVLGRAAAFSNDSADIAQILEYLLRDESKNRLF